MKVASKFGNILHIKLLTRNQSWQPIFQWAGAAAGAATSQDAHFSNGG